MLSFLLPKYLELVVDRTLRSILLCIQRNEIHPLENENE